jgi:amidase
MAGFLDAVMGPAPGEPVPWAKPDRPYVEEVDRDPGKFRVAMCSEQWGPIPIDKHITGEIQQVAKLLESAGHSVEEAVPAIDYEAYLNVFRQIWVIDISAMLDYEAELMGREVSADTVEPMTLKMYEAGKGATAAERLGISGFMSVISRQLGAFYEDYDLLLTPVLVDDTPPLGSPFNLVQEGQTLDDWFENAFHLIPITPLNNFTGTPAVSLPLCEDSTGMPLGAHIMAPIGREDRLFNVAGQIEKIAPWAGKKPPLHVTSA